MTCTSRVVDKKAVCHKHWTHRTNPCGADTPLQMERSQILPKSRPHSTLTHHALNPLAIASLPHT